MNLPSYDTVIVGAGPAGLSAALVLSRARQRVAVIDRGAPRNSRSPAVHGFLSRDGVPPAELKALAWEQIVRYGLTERVSARVKSLEADADGGTFTLRTAEGSPMRARSVVLAMGMEDILPSIPGLATLWGRSVIHCPFCYGWENADGRWGVYAATDAEARGAIGFRSWSADIRVFAAPSLHLSETTARMLRSAGIAVDRRPIRRFCLTDDGRLGGVEVEGSATVLCDTFVLKPPQRQTPLVSSLALSLDEIGRVVVDGASQTSVPGVFAAGDLVAGRQTVAAAVASGAATAMAIVSELAGKDVDEEQRPDRGARPSLAAAVQVM